MCEQKVGNSGCIVTPSMRLTRERETQRERQRQTETDRQTDRDRERERDTERALQVAYEVQLMELPVCFPTISQCGR